MKSLKPIIVGVGVLLLCFGVYSYYRAKLLGKEYAELSERFVKEEAARKVADKELADAKVLEAAIREGAKKDIDALVVVVASLQQDKKDLAKKWEAEKAKTAALTDSELASNLNSYYHNPYVTELRKGAFEISRPGAEATLNIFHDFSLAIEQKEKDKGIIFSLTAEVEKYKTVTVPSFERELVSTNKSLDKTRISLATSEKRVSTLEKLGTKKFWKGVSYGAGATAIVVLIFNLAKGLGK